MTPNSEEGAGCQPTPTPKRHPSPGNGTILPASCPDCSGLHRDAARADLHHDPTCPAAASLAEVMADDRAWFADHPGARERPVPAKTIHSLIYLPRVQVLANLRRLREQRDGATAGAERDRLDAEIRAVERQLAQPGWTLRGELATDAALIVADLLGDLRSFGVPILALGDNAQLAPVGGPSAFADRIIVLHNDPVAGVFNGQQLIVVQWPRPDPRNAGVLLAVVRTDDDDGEEFELRLDPAGFVDHRGEKQALGDARQGRGLVAAGYAEARRWLYTAVSRARHHVAVVPPNGVAELARGWAA